MIFQVNIPEKLAKGISKNEVLGFKDVIELYFRKDKDNELVKHLKQIENEGNFEVLKNPKDILSW